LTSLFQFSNRKIKKYVHAEAWKLYDSEIITHASICTEHIPIPAVWTCHNSNTALKSK
jgi:hypothetical protein